MENKEIESFRNINDEKQPSTSINKRCCYKRSMQKLEKQLIGHKLNYTSLHSLKGLCGW